MPSPPTPSKSSPTNETFPIGLRPGSIVRCRNREWVLLPSDSEETHMLRQLTGAVDEVVRSAPRHDLGGRVFWAQPVLQHFRSPK